MTEDKPVIEDKAPCIKGTIDKQAALIVDLQKRLREACIRNNAEDSNQFAQAMLVATQTWKLLLDTWEDVKPKPAATYQTYQSDPTLRRGP